MTGFRVTAAVGLALIGLPIMLPAQRAIGLLGSGIEAYQRLDLDGAARLLREALASDSGRGLAPSLQTRGLAYLGATELLRSHPDSARAAFRRILEIDPDYRPDATVFPPQVTDLFELVRHSVHPLTVRVAPESRFRARSESLHVSVRSPGRATSARARLEREDGALVRELFDGILGDSLTLGWDGLDARGAVAPPGRYRLIVSLTGSSTTTERVARIPLAIDQWVASPDSPTRTAAPSSVPRRLPERPSAGPAWPALVAGIAAAGAAVTLPHAVSPGVDDSPRRLVVPIAIGTAGLVGFLLHRHAHSPPRMVPDPIPPGIPPSKPPAGAGDITLIVHAGPVVVQ